MFKALHRSWSHHFSLQLATSLVMAASFFTVIVFLSIYINLDQILTLWGKNLQMTVFLEPTADESQIAQIQQFLSSEEGIEGSEFISSDQAIERFQAQVSEYAPDMFTTTELRGLVPPSFEVVLSNEVLEGDPTRSMRALGQNIIEFSGVEDISYGQAWISKYSSILRGYTYIGAFITGLLLIGCLFISANSIRVAIQQRHEEIEILELIGASPRMIRRPFIFEGMFNGLMSTAIALATSTMLFWLLKNAFAGQLAFLGLSSSVTLLPVSLQIGVLFVGGGIGALGAWLCVFRLNSGWSASQRVEKW